MMLECLEFRVCGSVRVSFSIIVSFTVSIDICDGTQLSGCQNNIRYTYDVRFNILNKKHLKNVGPIRLNEPSHANSPGVATVLSHAACASMSTTTTTTTTTRDRGPLWPHGMGPIIRWEHMLLQILYDAYNVVHFVIFLWRNTDCTDGKARGGKCHRLVALNRHSRLMTSSQVCSVRHRCMVGVYLRTSNP